MSRTTRNYPNYHLDCHGLAAYEYTWLGLYVIGVSYDIDPRDDFIHGYDGLSLSYYYSNYGHAGADRDSYKGKSRKFYKRRYHKARRRLKIELD